MGRAPVTDGRGDAWHLHRELPILSSIRCASATAARCRPWGRISSTGSTILSRPPPQHDGGGPASVKFRQSDEIAFVLDTRFGELEIYHSRYDQGRCRGPEFHPTTRSTRLVGSRSRATSSSTSKSTTTLQALREAVPGSGDHKVKPFEHARRAATNEGTDAEDGHALR